jgi:HAD superfamily hydrolase (TIGR01458 family)
MSQDLLNVKGLLIDLGGVVYQGSCALPGSVDAVRRLQSNGFPFRFLTNTTSSPKRDIQAKLANLGVQVDADDIFTPADAARSFIVKHDLRPSFLISPNLQEDFADIAGGTVPAVVVGDAGNAFTYQNLNHAFRELEAGARLVALASNRKFVDEDGLPCMDVGAFVAALEYASGKKAVVLGKPSAEFFQLAVDTMHLSKAEVAMIGDDAEFDASAAISAGLGGVLVQTGKWEPRARNDVNPPPTAEFANLGDAVDNILQSFVLTH